MHDHFYHYLKNKALRLAVHQILSCTWEIYLGAVHDTKLSLRNHISMSINKDNRLLGIIRRSFCALDNTSFTLHYKTIVRPHHENAASIWNPYKKGYIDNFENVQCSATKLLQNIFYLSYPDRLAALNLPTLVYRPIRGNMTDSFKILNNIYDSKVTNFLSKSNFSTREHNLKLFVQHANFDIRKWFFSIRIANIWNRLPSNLVNAPNVKCLEKRLNKC